MKKLKDKIYNKVGIKSDRTKNITKHVGLSFIYKGGSMISTFLLVPLTIDFLDTENYGIWLTLSSFIAWFSFFDIGLGNGLRNKFAEAKAKGDLTLAKGYVSTAYFTIGVVCLGLFVLFFAVNFFIDWTKVFNASNNLQRDLSILMPIVFGFFCLQLVVKLITTIYTADQNASMQGKVGFLTQAGSLLVIWLMTLTAKSSLLIFGIIFSALPVFILLFLNFFAFSNTYKDYKPTFSLWKKDYLKDIFGLGFMFFIIQVSGLIIYSTDNIVITQLFGPREVVPYGVTFKYFNISTMILTMVLIPYWSSFTEAYTKGDFEWIKTSMKNLNKVSISSVFLVFIMLIISPFVYKLWLGDKVNIEFSLSVFMSIFFITNIIFLPYTFLLNGTGKLKLQLYFYIITALINIPLSIFLAKNMELGVSGIIIATVICLIPQAILCPIQYRKIINKNATGIWNK